MHFKNPGRIKYFLKDPNKKSFFKICKEVLVLWVNKKELPMYYFKHLYKKEVTNYKDYIGTKVVRRIKASTKLHKQEYIYILNNKLSFLLYCKKNAIPTPSLIAYNFGHNFFLGIDVREVSNIDELADFYSDVFKSNQVDVIFFRPLSLNGGKGCFKLYRKTFLQQLASEYENLINGDYIATEVITQHPDINAIYSKSINTVRIVTHNDNGCFKVIYSIIRFGVNGSVVDNASAGGLCVAINQESGTLKDLAYRNLEFGGGNFDKHPDTDFKFENFLVPYFKESCELVKAASKRIPNGLIGWDIAVTPTGPTIIEGNADPAFFVPELLHGGLMKNPYMKKLIAAI